MLPFFRRDYNALMDDLLTLMVRANLAAAQCEQMTLVDSEDREWASVEARFVATTPLKSFWVLHPLRNEQMPTVVTYVVEDAVRSLLRFASVPYIGGTAYAGVTTAANVAYCPANYAQYVWRVAPLGTNYVVRQIQWIKDDGRFLLVGGDSRPIKWVTGDTDIHLYSGDIR